VTYRRLYPRQAEMSGHRRARRLEIQTLALDRAGRRPILDRDGRRRLQRQVRVEQPGGTQHLSLRQPRARASARGERPLVLMVCSSGVG
jgi:hypothetical protein